MCLELVVFLVRSLLVAQNVRGGVDTVCEQGRSDELFLCLNMCVTEHKGVKVGVVVWVEVKCAAQYVLSDWASAVVFDGIFRSG